MTLIPTVETDNREELQEKINLYKSLPGQKPSHFQIDIVDGLFADMLTIMPESLQDIDWHGLTFETHLLVNDPDDYIGETHAAGATGIIAQIEHLRNRQNFVQVVHELGKTAGLALDIHTPISELTDIDLQLTDCVLLMAVPAGFAGQTLNPQVVDKIQELRARGFTKSIEIDGGVNESNISSLLQAGATSLAVNSSLWHDNVMENLRTLLRAEEAVK